MVKPLAKRQSIQELTQQLSEAYAALLLQKEFFELNKPHYPTEPVRAELYKFVNALEQLHAKGRRIKVDISQLPEEFLHLNEKSWQFIEQARLKEELLKKHGPEKLERFRNRKRKKFPITRRRLPK